jgi:benzoyl-CoA reductase subunit D
MRPVVTAGIDVGTSSVKAAVMRSRAGDAGEILGTAVQRIRRRDLCEVVRAAFGEACAMASVAPEDLVYVATTGEADAVDFRTGHFYSMTTHARGALFLVPEARAVIDIGALHARAIRIDARGKVLGHRMTSQCASGSGQFLENIARYLGVALEDVGRLSRQAAAPEEVSSICAVLAETDVINMVSRGLETADIVKGIHLSIAGRLLSLLRAVGVEGPVCATGGLAKDEGLLAALGERIESERGRRGALASLSLHAPPLAILAGAIGAALLGAYRQAQLGARAVTSTVPGGA